MLATLGVPLAVAAILSDQVYACALLLAFFYAMLNSYYGLVYSSIQDVVAPNMRGSAMALYFLAMYFCGASFGPLLTGKLSDLLAQRAAEAAGSASVSEVFRATGLQQAMLVMPLLSLLLAVVLYLGSTTIGQDAQRRDSALRANPVSL